MEPVAKRGKQPGFRTTKVNAEEIKGEFAMKNKLIKIGFLLAICLAPASVSRVAALPAENFETGGLASTNNRCQVTERTTIFINSLNQDYVLDAGTRLIVVNAEPHQGYIVVKMRIHRKWQRGEIKYEDTDCI